MRTCLAIVVLTVLTAAGGLCAQTPTDSAAIDALSVNPDGTRDTAWERRARALAKSNAEHEASVDSTVRDVDSLAARTDSAARAACNSEPTYVAECAPYYSPPRKPPE